MGKKNSCENPIHRTLMKLNCPNDFYLSLKCVGFFYDQQQIRATICCLEGWQIYQTLYHLSRETGCCERRMYKVNLYNQIYWKYDLYFHFGLFL